MSDTERAPVVNVRVQLHHRPITLRELIAEHAQQRAQLTAVRELADRVNDRITERNRTLGDITREQIGAALDAALAVQVPQ